MFQYTRNSWSSITAFNPLAAQMGTTQTTVLFLSLSYSAKSGLSVYNKGLTGMWEEWARLCA